MLIREIAPENLANFASHPPDTRGWCLVGNHGYIGIYWHIKGQK
jgi:hypothetical protein